MTCSDLSCTARFRFRQQKIVCRVQFSGLQPVFPCVGRPKRKISAAILLIPAHAAGLPNGSAEHLLNLLIKALLHLILHHNGLGLGFFNKLHHLQNVFHLRFNHENHGIMRQHGVWAQQLEQVGKAFGADAIVAFCAVFPCIL